MSLASTGSVVVRTGAFGFLVSRFPLGISFSLEVALWALVKKSGRNASDLKYDDGRVIGVGLDVDLL